MKSTRKIIALILALVLLIAAGGCGQKTADNNANTPSTTNPETKEKLKGTIKFGLVYAQSGPSTKYSRAYADAVKFAIDEANKSGILEDAKFEIYEADQGSSAESAINAFQRLITTDKVSIITGPDVVPFAYGAMPIAQKAGVLVASTNTDSGLAGIGDMVFGFGTMYAEILPNIIEQVVKAKNIKTAAIVTQKDNPQSVANTKVRIDVLSKLGVKVVLNEQGIKSDQDFSTVLTKINNIKPDVVFADGSVPWEPLFWTQLNNSGYAGIRMSGLTGTSVVVKTNKEAYEGQLNGVTYLAGMPGASAEIQGLETRFKAASGQTLDQFTLDRYDMIMTLVNVFKKAGTVTDIKAIRDTLLIMEYEGSRGSRNFTDKRNLEPAKPFLVQIQNGNLVPFNQ